MSAPELFASFSMLVASVGFLVYRIVPGRGLEPRFLALDLGLALILLVGVFYSVSLVLLVIAALAISYPLAELLRLFLYWLGRRKRLGVLDLRVRGLHGP